MWRRSQSVSFAGLHPFKKQHAGRCWVYPSPSSHRRVPLAAPDLPRAAPSGRIVRRKTGKQPQREIAQSRRKGNRYRDRDRLGNAEYMQRGNDQSISLQSPLGGWQACIQPAEGKEARNSGEVHIVPKYDNNTWPSAKCILCEEKGRECSAPELMPRAQKSYKAGHPEHNISVEANMPLKTQGQTTESSVRLSEGMAEASCKEAIFLLSLHTVLLMCIEELVNLITDMIHPFQRDLQRESREDNLPELSTAVDCLKQDARLVNLKMIAAARQATKETFLLAQNALNTHCFRRNLSWGVDHTSVAECRSSITQFQQLGHTSFAYVLQVRLLQENIALSDVELKAMNYSRNEFVMEADRYFKLLPPRFEGRQMFTPKELVRIPVFAEAVSADGRPDYLGRSVAQIMFDAGVSTVWPSDAIRYRDVLGRTALHQAAHRQDVHTLELLLNGSVDLGQCCLNKLSLLHIAACQGHTKMVRLLIARAPCLVDLPDGAGRTPFWYAARSNRLGVMKLFSSREDVNLDHRDFRQLSASAVAARDGRYELLGSLLRMKSDRIKKGIAPEAERSVDHLPLLLASQARRTDCLRLILELRSWKAGDAEYSRLLEAAEHWQDEKLKNILIYAIMFGTNLQDGSADIRELLLEPPKSTGKSPPPNYPYVLGARARLPPGANPTMKEIQSGSSQLRIAQ
ncbi:hypothetical protein OPT61_g3603 [Boeremia exigua]|uniref:Uncharacterized protein n=1 Tax=Boeremia exigua TaxID=749465 RepID=A0ACC2IH83_9PLEO|nr:hypothetical protein OPT61_g3603 [Boeremia exigua]